MMLGQMYETPMKAGFEAKESPWRFAVAPMMDGTKYFRNYRFIRELKESQSFML